MVISLKTLANKRTNVFALHSFSILRNTAEPYEVRVAAALNIFLAFPTAEMMQIMAHMTNDDPSLQISMSICNEQDLFNYLKIPFSTYQYSSDPFVKFPAKKVAAELNITRKHDPIEGAMFIDNMNQQRLFTFGQRDLHFLNSDASQKVQRLLTGDEHQYTKVINAKQVIVTFPLASDKNIEFTYLRNMDGSVGFLDTITGVYASSGVINKLQYFVPLKLTTKPKFCKVPPSKLIFGKDANLVHMSVFPTHLCKKTLFDHQGDDKLDLRATSLVLQASVRTVIVKAG
ncbi:hypothetical protein HF086_004548 [Spodoptera exigua]|uniref:Vitellogenin domain-containing protein n=1 Tax=Spodoptera exigua TaxID=7107 RepID=A0A922SE78_SPOEX|nr:hypothetical protein HF086_004548 [Spodoptera exigua]